MKSVYNVLNTLFALGGMNVQSYRVNSELISIGLVGYFKRIVDSIILNCRTY